MSSNDITKYAASIDPIFNYSGAQGGSIEVVGASSDKAAAAASQILASLSIAKNSGIFAALGGAVSVAALGQLDPLAIGAGAMAGAITTLTKGRSV